MRDHVTHAFGPVGRSTQNLFMTVLVNAGLVSFFVGTLTITK